MSRALARRALVALLASVATLRPGRAAAQERTTLGGYGEVHYANRTGPDTPGIVDLKRFVVYLAHAFNDQIAFRSELEVEDAKLEGAQPGGEVALEQAYLDYRLSDALTVRRITTFGLSYKPTYNTAFKGDYQLLRNEAGTGATDVLSLGIGYQF